MILYDIRGDGVDLTPSIRDHIEKKVQKIERYFSDDTNATAHIYVRNHNTAQTKVEVTVPMKNLTLRAEELHNDMYGAVDLIVDKLERQIRKYKTKVNRKFRDREGVGVAFAIAENEARQQHEEAENDDELKIVRTKQFSLKPMDEEEAVLQMNMLGHDFFIFTDAETNGTNIVYKRKDGTYGLIETS